MPKVSSKLISDANGAEIKVGDAVTTFRGEKVTVTGWSAPTHPGSTGRVYVKGPDGSEMEYFPGVVKAHIVAL